MDAMAFLIAKKTDIAFINGGSPVDQVVGALPKAALKGRIDKAIS